VPHKDPAERRRYAAEWRARNRERINEQQNRRQAANQRDQRAYAARRRQEQRENRASETAAEQKRRRRLKVLQQRRYRAKRRERATPEHAERLRKLDERIAQQTERLANAQRLREQATYELHSYRQSIQGRRPSRAEAAELHRRARAVDVARAREDEIRAELTEARARRLNLT